MYTGNNEMTSVPEEVFGVPLGYTVAGEASSRCRNS